MFRRLFRKYPAECILHMCLVAMQVNIDKIVDAVKFTDDLVAGEELLGAFQLVDENVSKKVSA